MGPITTAILMEATPELIKGATGVIRSLIEGSYQLKAQKLAIAEQRRQFDQNRVDRINEQSNYFKETLKQALNNYFLENAWPLNVSPDHLGILKNQNDMVILRVFIAKPKCTDDSIENLLELVNHKLQTLITTDFGIESRMPIDLYVDSWRDNHYGTHADLDSIHHILNGQPTLVLMPTLVHDNTKLILRGAFWGIGNMNNSTNIHTLFTLDIKKLQIQIAREYAKVWRDMKSTLNIEDIDTLNEVDSSNLRVMMKEESLIKSAIDERSIEKCFKISNDFILNDPRFISDLSDYLSSYYQVIISCIADIYYYLEYGLSPSLPYVLTHIAQPSCLPMISSLALPLYQSFRSIVEDQEIPHLEMKPMSKVAEVIKSSLFTKGDRCENISSGKISIRLLWDERISELMRTMLVSEYSKETEETLSHHLFELIAHIDNSVKEQDVRCGVQKLLNDSDIKTILFSYSCRHPEIIEVTRCAAYASYMIYRVIGNEGGINWLIAYELAEQIAQKVIDQNNLTTPALIIDENKFFVLHTLSKILNSFHVNFDNEKIQTLYTAGKFRENERILADICYRHLLRG